MSDRARERGRVAIYTMAGAYLLIMAYNMIKNLDTSSGTERILMIVFTILFVIIGGGLVIWGLRTWVKLTRERAEEEKAAAEAEAAAETIEGDAAENLPGDDIQRIEGDSAGTTTGDIEGDIASDTTGDEQTREDGSEADADESAVPEGKASEIVKDGDEIAADEESVKQESDE